MYLPSSDSGRLIVGTWWLGVLVVVTTYCGEMLTSHKVQTNFKIFSSGNLVAFLTFPKIENPISNLHQLLHSSHDVTWSIRSKTFFEYYIKVSEMRGRCNQTKWFFFLYFSLLKNSENYKYKALNDGAMYTSNASNEIIDSVKIGKHIHIDWKSNLKFIMRNDYLETERCELGIGKCLRAFVLAVRFINVLLRLL